MEGGAIEVLEGLLRQRDIDKELYQSLRLKSLEIGLKIRLLQTDAGGRTVEVGSMYLAYCGDLLLDSAINCVTTRNVMPRTKEIHLVLYKPPGLERTRNCEHIFYL